MDLEITSFDPVRAPECDLVAHHAIANASRARDYPDRPAIVFDAYVDVLRAPVSFWGPKRFWVARRGGRIGGTAMVEYPERENRHSAIATVRVPPDLRRRGIGTALLGAVLPDCRAEGRSTVVGYGVKCGAAGESWIGGLGFARATEYICQILRIPATDPARWQVAPPDGFHAHRWTGAAPDDLIAALAVARTAIHDAPHGHAGLRPPDWTVDRIRRHEAAARQRDWELHTAVAIHQASGRVVGLTELAIPRGLPDTASQLDTAVRAGYRGHGLGRFLKATLMRWLVAERPQLTTVFTRTAADNSHMIRVNHQLGYTTDHTLADFEIGLDLLQNRLSSR